MNNYNKALEERTADIKEFNKDYFMEKTINSPEVSLCEGILRIKGKALTEDSNITRGVYSPVLGKLEEWILREKLKSIEIDLENFNCNNSKYLFNLLTSYVNKMNDVNPENVKISWIYASGDKTMMEIGKDFQNYVPVNFEFIEK